MLNSSAAVPPSGIPSVTSLHIDTRPDWRGGQNQVLLTLRGLRARRHYVELLALRGGALESRARAEGFPVHHIPPSRVRLGGAAVLRNLLTRGKFQIVHAHDPHGLTAAWLAHAPRRAVLVAQRRVAGHITRSSVGLARYRAAHRIFAISRFVARSVIDSGIDPARVEIVYEGVEIPPPVTLEARRKARRHFGIRDSEILLGCVGYLLPEKGQEALVRALPAVRARFPQCRLLLAGDGPSRKALESLALQSGLADAVVFGGFIEKIAQAYEALDIFLFPSIAEPLGTSLLAAMAYGLPVIAVAGGGVPEIVDSGCSGILVSSSAAQPLADAILRLLGDRELAKRLGSAARETIEQRFTADRMVEGTIAAYRKLLKEFSL
jgi:glycosyltransferase involved in cell wall biosynthesis